MGVYNDFMTAMPGIIGHYSLSPVKIFVLAGVFRCFFFFFFCNPLLSDSGIFVVQ